MLVGQEVASEEPILWGASLWRTPFLISLLSPNPVWLLFFFFFFKLTNFDSYMGFWILPRVIFNCWQFYVMLIVSPKPNIFLSQFLQDPVWPLWHGPLFHLWQVLALAAWVIINFILCGLFLLSQNFPWQPSKSTRRVKLPGWRFESVMKRKKVLEGNNVIKNYDSKPPILKNWPVKIWDSNVFEGWFTFLQT